MHEKRLNRQSEKCDTFDNRLTVVEGKTGHNSWFVQAVQGSILTKYHWFIVLFSTLIYVSSFI